MTREAENAAPYPAACANPDFVALEQEILAFWKREGIFQKSVDKNRGKGEPYVFYDGPPFANGLPHYGHLLTGYVKDVVARYQTMRGRVVERRFGWDCHGLPAEMAAEQELGISGRQAIIDYGIGKFNAHCRDSVMKYAHEWERYVDRQGRWVDFRNDYKTMDRDFMESVLWAFSELYKKGLIYESYRVMPYSWAAETPLSNFETRLDNATREREDKAITVAFELNERPNFQDESSDAIEILRLQEVKKFYLIAWTTTPWTLPSNLALAVHGYNAYIPHIVGDKAYIATTDGIKKTFGVEYKSGSTGDEDITIEELAEKYKNHVPFILGRNLCGLSYKPLFPYFKDHPDAFRILNGADFIEVGSGTGVVHLAPGFGEDDQKTCEKNGISIICPVDDKGRYTEEIYDLPFGTDDSSHRLRGEVGRGVSQPLAHGVGGAEYTTRDGQALERAQELRKNSTEAEKALWQLLRGKQLEGYKFRRQHAVGKYIADFACLERMLIIELDGGQHNQEANQHYDAKRTAYLEEAGYRVLRFWNNDVLGNMEGVYEIILKTLDTPTSYDTPTPTLPRKREREPLPQGGSSLRLRGLNVIADTNKSPDEPYTEAQLQKYGLANLRIINWLKQNGQLIKQEDFKHNYPHCWRTDTPIIYRALPSWYVKVSAFKDRAVELNRNIRWIPEHTRDGAMGHMLGSAPDWSISRNRFWGCPIPVWKSPSGKIKVFGSIAELEAASGQKVEDLHRPFIDEIVIHDGGEEYRRVEEVLDCWFESGSMPYASQWSEIRNQNPEIRTPNSDFRLRTSDFRFPADFITEYIGQTRGWFNTLIMLATALFDEQPFKNCICHGVVIDEETGLKYSKRLKNYKDPMEVFDTFGADALRWLMVSSGVMRGHDLGVDPEGKFIRDVVRLNIKPIWNAYNFFTLYANADRVKAEFSTDSENVMDQYILAKCRAMAEGIEKSLEGYDTPGACDSVTKFVEVLNNWYIRRSRPRFWESGKTADKQAAYNTLYTVLHTLCRAAAPLLPFTLEAVFRGLCSPLAGERASDARAVGGNNAVVSPPTESLRDSTPPQGGSSSPASVHLQDFPAELLGYQTKDATLMRDMDLTQDICNVAHGIRNKARVRTRQPLGSLTIVGKVLEVEAAKKFEALIKEEVNLKEITYRANLDEVAEYKLKIDFKLVGKRLPQHVKAIIATSKKPDRPSWKLKNKIRWFGEWKANSHLSAEDRNAIFKDDTFLPVGTKIIEPGWLPNNETKKLEIVPGGWIVTEDLNPKPIGEVIYLNEDEYEIKLEAKGVNQDATQPLPNNNALITLDLTLTPELIAEGMARDVVRMVQESRKKADLHISDKIALVITAPATVSQAVSSFTDYIAGQVLAESVTVGAGSGDFFYVHELEGEKVVISFSKVA